MLSVSALIHGTVTVRDVRRHGRGTRGVPAPLLHFTATHPPVVVWNVTRRCNLHCVHCYASAQDRPYPGELTTAEGLALLADLAGFGVPVVLFSGGEPLTRSDLFTLMQRARALGMRTVLSTNGTLIGTAEATALRAVGVSYVGVSLDGLERTHDRVRGHGAPFRRRWPASRPARPPGCA